MGTRVCAVLAAVLGAVFAPGCSLILDFDDEPAPAIDAVLCNASEMNNSLETAVATVNGTLNEAICPRGDLDFYRFNVMASRRVALTVSYDAALASDAKLSMTLHQALDGLELESASDDDGDGALSIERRGALSNELPAGDYTLQVRASDKVQLTYTLDMLVTLGPVGAGAMALIAVMAPERGLVDQIGELVARFQDRVVWCQSVAEVQAAHADLVVARAPIAELEQLGRAPHPPWIAVGASDLLAAYRAGASYCVVEPYHPRELLSQLHATLARQHRVVCLGGGAGLFAALTALKRLARTHLTAVVSVCDDGGSSGRLRAEFGVLPPGDIRRSMVALSSAPHLMNDLIQYRFESGEGLKDHNLGNLLVTAFTHLTGSFSEAVRAMGDLLNIQGVVLPVSDQPASLCAEFVDGSVVRGEHRIDRAEGRDPSLRVTRIWLEPEIAVSPNVVSAVLAADLITLGPGDLYTSVLVNLAVTGLREVLRAARARVVYVCNLMTKQGETPDFVASDHVRAVIAALGPGVLGHVLLSDSSWSQPQLAEYARLGQHPVRADTDVIEQELGVPVSVRDIGSQALLVRHDPHRLADALAALVPIPE